MSAQGRNVFRVVRDELEPLRASKTSTCGTRKTSLKRIAEHPLILSEKGSTGRQHVLDAFDQQGLAPTVALETTSTETVVSMIEAGLGVSIVPLMANGAVTRNRRVEVRAIEEAIRPIHSSVLLRRGETPSAPVAQLLAFITSRSPSAEVATKDPSVTTGDR